MQSIALVSKHCKLYGASQPSIASIGGLPIWMLDIVLGRSSTYPSSQSLPTSSEAIVPNVAKLANAITVDASGIKCVFEGPLSLCEGILCEYKMMVTLILRTNNL